MAKINILYLTAALFIFITIFQSSSAARPLNNNGLLPNAATEPSLNLALPGESENSSEKINSGSNVGQVIDCEIQLPKRSSLAGNYKSLFLNALRKGTVVPPSGPSKRTNSINN